MALYEALYGWPCKTLVCWNEVGERKLLGLKLVQQTSENVNLTRDNLKVARDRQKSYANKQRRELEFEVKDQVFLQLPLWKGILRFGRKATFRTSSYTWCIPWLRKYVSDPTHVLREQPVQLKENFSYEEEPVEILERNEQVHRNKTIPLVKVLWNNHANEEAT
ncbi:uncharacterized protein LOC120084616 [Benincasa hispida]|uniref:uncharacterized protein LOC120084616 n=1 Tax=Benincasa hispida TaxID=102211 RepID=UPI0018FFB7B4|nr:uncharacterized protein LOC120084616 [Benincasa hispida]